MSDNPVNDTVTDPDRLDAVRGTGLLDSDPEAEFDRLTRLAAKLTGAPVTFISLFDRDLYKACFGFPEPLASERQLSGTTFCHYAIASDGPLVIDDTLADARYREVSRSSWPAARPSARSAPSTSRRIAGRRWTSR